MGKLTYIEQLEWRGWKLKNFILNRWRYKNAREPLRFSLKYKIFLKTFCLKHSSFYFILKKVYKLTDLTYNIRWITFNSIFLLLYHINPFYFINHKNCDLHNGHSLLLLLLNHFMIQFEWNFFLHVLHAFLGKWPLGSTIS